MFVAGGVETVSRFMYGVADSGGRQPEVRATRGPHEARTEGGQPQWTPPVGLPDVYIAMGQTAENVAEPEGVTREEMDEFGARVAAARRRARRRTASSSARSPR